MKEFQQIVTLLEGGAIPDSARIVLVEAICASLIPDLNHLADQFHELEGDVYVAIGAMRRAAGKAE